MKLLFTVSELFPLIKTGGLADVAHSLPNALAGLQVDVRVVLPAYRPVLTRVAGFRVLGWLTLSSGREVRILEANHPEVAAPLWLVDAPDLFDRPGTPYADAEGHDWEDNPARFALFSEAAALLAMDALEIGWRADVVHANDWQTGLVAAFLATGPSRPRTLFTVHNLAYDCQFDYGTFHSLQLPHYWWSVEYGEFYERFSMLKAGLVFSDVITTVSPNYAQEIRTKEYGYGYASILEANKDRLVGILNGIDDETWNPSTDPLLAANYRCRRRHPRRQEGQPQGPAGRPRRHPGGTRPQGAPGRFRRPPGSPERHRPVTGRDTLPARQQRGPVRPDRHGRNRTRTAAQNICTGLARPGLLPHRLFGDPRPPTGGRLRYLRHAVASRTLRPQPDVQPALWDATGRARHRWPGRHG